MPYQGEVLANTYQIVDEIGKGGAGIIYRAYHLNLHKYVVVKKIKDNFVGNLNARGEVDILKRLHHTCLPQVYDFLQIGNEVYTVMDYIEGHDFKYYIDNGYAFPEESIWLWLEQLSDVLDYLHKKGILHSDIKPANIMLTSEGNACLIDFNISLDGEDNLIGLSETYAAPEQIMKWQGIVNRNANAQIVLDERMDIYSLGVTFYHMMTGAKPSPYQGQMLPILQYGLPYSNDLVNIVSKMTQHEIKKRYQSAGKVKQAVSNAKKTKAEKWTLRIVFAVMLCAVVVLMGAIIGVSVRSGRGISDKQMQAIRQEESRLAGLCDYGDYEQAKNEGLAYLRQEADSLEKAEGAKQSILERIVDASMGAGDYQTASTYLTELFKIAQKAEYYQDLAVISAYTGDTQTAYQALDKAVSLGGDAFEIEKNKAEIYAAQGDYANAIALYEESYKKTASSATARRIAALNLKAAVATSDNLWQVKYAESAVQWYEALSTSGMSSYNDRLNLATAYCLNNMNEMAMGVLQGVIVDYPDNYEAFLQLAILNYNSEMAKAPANRDFGRTKEYTQKAKKLFSDKATGKQDEQLESFVRIIEELQ